MAVIYTTRSARLARALSVVGDEYGGPAWVIVPVLAFVVAVALISIVDGWQLLGEALHLLARS